MRDVPGNIDPWFRMQQDNGGGLGFEKLDLRRGDFTIFASHFERRHHERKRLFFTVLALAQAGYRCGLACIDKKLKSSDAFEGQDFALLQSCCDLGEGLVELR